MTTHLCMSKDLPVKAGVCLCGEGRQVRRKKGALKPAGGRDG